MTTVLDLAAHAGLPVETVLRVLLREPTDKAARQSVELAVAELGLPDYPRPDDDVGALPAVSGPTDVEQAAPPSEALSVPALEAELVAELNELAERFERERRERINDLDLSTNLLTEGWRSVDRRLGRIEKIFERLVRDRSLERPDEDAEVHLLDDLRRPSA